MSAWIRAAETSSGAAGEACLPAVAVQEPARSATADTKATTRGMPSILQGRGVAAEGEHRHSNTWRPASAGPPLNTRGSQYMGQALVPSVDARPESGGTEQAVDVLRPWHVDCLPPMPKHPDDQRLELLQGTLDMLILRTLQWGPQHGHGIGQAIRRQSDELLKVETGSLYPALHRLEKRGWLKSEWDVSEANQRAKYYRLTAAGKAQLSRERDRWSQLVAAIGRIMNPAPAGDD
jgi:PadR family transcriptional regulator PadR